MHHSSKGKFLSSLTSRPGTRALRKFAAVVLSCILSGCAALTNPVADGLPVRKLPPEFLGESREGEQTVPLNLLRQSQPEAYLLAPGDVLGVWIEGVDLLYLPNQLPPVNSSQRALPPERLDLPPSQGLPVPVREDGTVSVPFLDPVPVNGLTLAAAREKLRQAYYAKKKVPEPGNERMVVTLMRPRTAHVLVFRHDVALTTLSVNLDNNFIVTNVGSPNGATELVGRSPNGAGHVVDLPGYDNDVLTALASTGGLPSSSAANEIVIYRGYLKGNQDKAAVIRQLETLRPGCRPPCGPGMEGEVVRIPLRLRPGEEPSFRPEDIVLHNGDALFVEAREVEKFYTAGLLPPGEHVLPRDYDLDVVQAVARVKGPLVNGAFAQSNLNGFIIPRGIGNPNPSLLTVLRKTPGGGQVPIRVDLNRALCDPRERILVQAGDVLVLQETPAEAFVRYFTDVFTFRFDGQIIQGRKTPGTITTTIP